MFDVAEVLACGHRPGVQQSPVPLRARTHRSHVRVRPGNGSAQVGQFGVSNHPLVIEFLQSGAQRGHPITLGQHHQSVPVAVNVEVHGLQVDE